MLFLALLFIVFLALAAFFAPRPIAPSLGALFVAVLLLGIAVFRPVAEALR